MAAASTLTSTTSEDLAAAIDAYATAWRDHDQVPDRIEALAVIVELAHRSTGLRPFRTQVLGALAAIDGSVVSMGTGEGKTLAITLAATYFALAGRGVHVVTANAYLAARDAAFSDALLSTIGRHSAFADPQAPDRTDAYRADVTYTTAPQIGFDYLTDQMVLDADARQQRSPFAVIVDEADSLLLDEASAPLTVSGRGAPADQAWRDATDLAARLLADPANIGIDTQMGHVWLTAEGIASFESFVGPFEEHFTTFRFVLTAVRAATLFVEGRDYLVVDDAVVLVDEHTGRQQPGRRLLHGVHEALEARHGLVPKRAQVTMGSVTFPALFGRYDHLAGFTGTLGNDAEELETTFGMSAVTVPPNVPIQRVDLPDRIFATATDRDNALVAEAVRRHRAGQPVLVAAPSVARADELAVQLTSAGIDSVGVLHARAHGSEAAVIAAAGSLGSVVVTTNMAGRGVDIVLGGDVSDPGAGDAVRDVGGLAVLGATRFASARLDDQLRGRAGRQGDPGVTQFFVSLDDELLDGVVPASLRSMFPSGELPASLVASVIDRAQRSHESWAFDQRQSLLRVDAVMRRQRDTYYAWRDELLALDPAEVVAQVAGLAFRAALGALPARRTGRDATAVAAAVAPYWPGQVPALQPDWTRDRVAAEMAALAVLEFASRLQPVRARADDVTFERYARGYAAKVILAALDEVWASHLVTLEHLRADMSLVRYSQRDPANWFAAAASHQFDGFAAKAAQRAVEVMLRSRAAVPASQEPSGA